MRRRGSSGSSGDNSGAPVLLRSPPPHTPAKSVLAGRHTLHNILQHNILRASSAGQPWSWRRYRLPACPPAAAPSPPATSAASFACPASHGKRLLASSAKDSMEAMLTGAEPLSTWRARDEGHWLDAKGEGSSTMRSGRMQTAEGQLAFNCVVARLWLALGDQDIVLYPHADPSQLCAG